MPKRTDIEKILVIGSGPIVIGQACEFDYSGTQCLKALKEEGFFTILVNSNPATIMTDPELSDRTYIEPITCEALAQIIEKEKPDAILPTLGGQTALNATLDLFEAGVLEKYNLKVLGASIDSIKKSENRDLFKKAMQKIGLTLPESAYVNTFDDAKKAVKEIGFPIIIRPSFTLGGTGGNIAYDESEFEELINWGLSASPKNEVLLEQSIIGWKEYELEVMRDKADNVIIICSIENFDAMGVHTGDSITVAPAQTLSDKEYQIMRNAAIAVIREIGVDTGGSNIQFAVNPANGDLIIIEMNPRVSRSSALASKATGFPIAKIATKLAIGYRLDEIPNDITKKTFACFEPSIDYVVTKIPRFNFEKFPETDTSLTTQMKSVGEVMAIGRTFKESLQKAIRSLEIGVHGFKDYDNLSDEILEKNLKTPNPERIFFIAHALKNNFSLEIIHELTNIDPWFINQIKGIVDYEILMSKPPSLSPSLSLSKSESESEGESELTLRTAKKLGFSDKRIGQLLNLNENKVYVFRKKHDIFPCFKRVDTCAAEFEGLTPYLYSTYEDECEADPTNNKKIVILGSGPNRIGQGVEFDYSCVHASFVLKKIGYETIMVNCNPETVSTDYDTSSRLYFEPLTFEDVIHIINKEKPIGVILQYGGQTPLKLAQYLKKANVNILGTSQENIDIAEDREKFKNFIWEMKLKQPACDSVFSLPEAKKVAERIGYPVLVRPSYVIGGSAMKIIFNDMELEEYIVRAISVSEEKPILIDKYLENATEIDVDAVSDGEYVFVAGIMEHIEQAGIHSGDSSCVIPPITLSLSLQEAIRNQTIRIARGLSIVGLINIQFAVKGRDIYVLEVNPRASRTVPFISKAINVPLAKLAARVMLGESIRNFGLDFEYKPPHFSVKVPVFPFIKFPKVDTILGPEMKSTGEVMGIDKTFPAAFGKALIAAGMKLPKSGTAFISVKDEDKEHILWIAKKLIKLGFKLIATEGTQKFLKTCEISAEKINKVFEAHPNIIDKLNSGEIYLVINVVSGKKAIKDSFEIRRTALTKNIPHFVTLEAANAGVLAIEEIKKGGIDFQSLQEIHLLL